MRPIDLRCEHRRDVPCVDDPAPRLSWTLESSGAREAPVGVPRRRRAGPGPARRSWDSGRVESSSSVDVVYAGRALPPASDCWWVVQVWDEAGEPSPWSEPARFRTGLREWRAQWISRDDARRSGRAGARVGVGTRRRHHARALPAGAVPAPRVRGGGTGAPGDALRDRPWARRAASQRRAGRRRGARAGVDGLPQAHRVRGPRRDRAARRRDQRALGDPGRRLVLGLRRLRPQARRRPLRHAPGAALRAPPRVRGRRARGGGERRALARDDRADPLLGPPARRALRRAPRARRLDGSGLRRPRLARGAHA